MDNIWIEGCGANTRRWRVSQQDIGDGIGNTLRTVFVSSSPWAVSDAGFPQCPNFEFAGYGSVERQLSDVGSGSLYQVRVQAFHQRLGKTIDPRKGKVYQAQSKDGIGGTVIAQTDTSWTVATDRETNWVYTTDTTTWSGHSNAAHKTAYAYQTDHQNGGQYGNVTHVWEYADTGATLYRTRETWYYPRNETGTHIVNRPARQVLWAGNVGGTCTSDVRHLYDGQGGYDWPPLI